MTCRRTVLILRWLTMRPDAARTEWITEGGVSYVRTQIDAEWWAFARIIPQAGSPAIGELRIVPAVAAAAWNGPPPEWREADCPPVPSGGVLSDHLKRLPLHDYLQHEAEFRAWADMAIGGSRDVTAALTGVSAVGSVGSLRGSATLAVTATGALSLVGHPVTLIVGRRRRPGRPPEPPEMYAKIARDYAAACVSSRTPIKVLSRKWKLPEHVVRNRVSKARTVWGFLTPAKAGRRGGFLTEKAKEVLAP